MADYNSPYTGAEIDAGIARTDSIMEYVQVYAGAPTNAGVALDSLSINPSKGDRTGIYDIVFNRESTTPVVGSKIYLSRLYVKSADMECIGTSHVYMDAAQIKSQGTNYWDENGLFDAHDFTHDFGSDTATQIPMYIHEIWRLQEVQ